MITRRIVATLQAGLVAVGATAVTLGTGVVAYAGPGTPACPAAVISGTTATVTCNYSGGMQTWTVPAGIVSATFDVFGAQGGRNSVGSGNGGEATAAMTVVPGAVITVVVGARGQNVFVGGAGGYNGGGGAGGGPFRGSSGGGASDVRVGGVALTDRVLVAGGGGGDGTFAIGGGAGGGLSGNAGGSWGFGGTGGGGGTQLAAGGGGAGVGCCGGPGGAGSLGAGGSGGPGSSSSIGGGGGGGGYYGGGGGGVNSGGGGGSAFGPVGTTFATGNHGGNGVVTITYTLRSTSVGVICAPSSTTVGVTGVCTATVTDTNSGTTVTPTGTISFASSSTGTFNHTTCPNGPPTTTPSSMSCPVNYTPTAVATGTHTISVIYGGDLSTVASSSSGAGNSVITVAKGLTTTTLGSSSISAVVGQPVTYTASISVTSPGSGTPTGTFAFTESGVALTGCGTKTISAGGAACSTTYASPGSHPIVATYSSDSNFAASNSSLTQSVAIAATTTALASSSISAVVGQPVTYTASISVTAPGSGTPTGTFAFTDNGVTLTGCGARVISTGSATCSATYPSIGTHPIVATYSSDANFAASSHSVTESVVAAATTTALGSSATSNVVGEAITLTATVTVTAPGGGTPAGTVAFSDGSTAVSGCAAVALIGSGVATCSTAPATVGSHSFTAVYGGSASYGTSTSPAVGDTVSQASTALALASSSNASVVGQPVTYTASVNIAPPGSGSPTGTVGFTDNGTTITGCAAVAISGGSATCSATYLTPGTHPILATYSGDSNFVSSSQSLTQAVSQASTSVTVMATPAQSTAGDAVTIDITVKAVSPGTGNPTGTVTLLVDGTAFGTVALDSTIDSLAVVTTTALTTGSHRLTARYGGDANYIGAVSAVAATAAVVPVVAVPATGAGLHVAGSLGLSELGIVLVVYGAMALAWAARRRAGARPDRRW